MTVKTSALLIILLIVTSLLVSACEARQLEVAADDAVVVNVPAADSITAVRMADRIHFHDQLWEAKQFIEGDVRSETHVKVNAPMAARIRFQDQHLENRPQSHRPLTLAARIRFHDRLWEDRR